MPPDLDLRDFSYMPLDVVRLRDSELAVMASGEAFRAAVILWCASWHQVPASSLPDDDKLLASLAGFGKDVKGWRKLRTDAMRGFVKCSDGRFYHPVIAEKAIEADAKRRVQKKRTRAASEARWKDRDEPRHGQRDGDRDAPRNEVQGKGREEKGMEGIEKGMEGIKNPDPPSAKAFSDEVNALADRIMEAQGLDKQDIQAIGTVYTAKMWLEEWHWQPDLVVATITRIMAKRSKPPGSLKYFENAIADAHAEAARPAPAGTADTPRRQPRTSFADIATTLSKDRTHEPDPAADTANVIDIVAVRTSG